MEKKWAPWTWLPPIEIRRRMHLGHRDCCAHDRRDLSARNQDLIRTKSRSIMGGGPTLQNTPDREPLVKWTINREPDLEAT